MFRGRREMMSSAGQSSANVVLLPGSNRYQIKCADGSDVATGTVTVVRDSGKAALPRSPPPTFVDADGRNYRVTYQNILPEITVRWKNAPADGPYNVEVSSDGKTKSYRAAGSSHTFSEGAIGEGSHTIVYKAAQYKSKPTRLVIRFDNAAPKARITSPAEGSFRSGDTVKVAGVALKGWKAFAGGKTLPMDRQHRFSGEVVVPQGQDGLVIRLVQPGRGVHFYVRRGARASARN